MLIWNSIKLSLGKKSDNGRINLILEVSFQLSTSSQEKDVSGETDMGIKSKTIAPGAMEQMALLRCNNFNQAVPLLLANQHKNCLELLVMNSKSGKWSPVSYYREKYEKEKETCPSSYFEA